MRNWTNKEWDGTIFMIGMIIAFLGTIYLTYKNPSFAAQPTTENVLDIIKTMLTFAAGFIFKSALDALRRNGTQNNKENNS